MFKKFINKIKNYTKWLFKKPSILHNTKLETNEERLNKYPQLEEQTNEQKLNQYRTPDDIVFGVKWFEKYQSRLLWLLNTPIIKIWFRYVMRIRKDIDLDFKTPIIEISPNHYSWKAGKQFFYSSEIFKSQSENYNFSRKYRRIAKHSYRRILKKKIDDVKYLLPVQSTDFRTHDKYSKRLYFAFKPFWYLLHTIDWAMFDRYEELAKLSFGFSTLTVYPITNSDGYTRRYNHTESWATAVAADTADAVGGQEGDNIDSIVYGARYSGSSPEIHRLQLVFTTSSLGSGATISATVFSLCASGRTKVNDSSTTLEVNSMNPSFSSDISTTDYNKHGSVSFASMAISSWTDTAGTYNDFSLNGDGIANVSKTGNSNFGVRTGIDFNNSDPGASKTNSVGGYLAGHTGTSQDPKLVVTYTLPVAPTVTTEAVSSIAQTTATGNGTVSSDGGATVTERGVCWSTSSGSETAGGSHATSGGTTGAFTASMTGLTANTTYYVKAYAINSVGTSYGSEVSFTTLAAGPANLKSYDTNVVVNIKSINTNLIANVKSLDTIV